MRLLRFAASAAAVCLVVAVSLLFSPRAYSQVATGAFLGTVHDTSGAVVPNASVILTNDRMGFERRTLSDSVGDYRFSVVPVGTYKLRVEARGFAPEASEELGLDVGQERRTDFTLRPGTISSAVEVHAVSTPIDTTNGEKGLVLGTNQVTELPLNFREFTQLALLAPGAQNDFRQRIVFAKTNISVNGLRSQNANLMIDGTESNEYHFGGTSSLSFLDPEAIQEFKISTSNYSADLRGASYNTRVITKSGTNAIHGSTYEFVRNQIFDARNFFEYNLRDPVTGAELQGTARNPFRRNQFGGTVGGPVIKDKLFWFLDYDGLRERLGTSGFASVPTALERQGTLNTINPITGKADTLYVPVGPKMAEVINRYPLPNLPNGPYGARTYYGNISTVTNFDQYTMKLDWQKSEKDTYSARWTLHNETGPNAPNIPLGKDYGQFQKEWSRNASFSNTHIFSPAWVNEFRAGYSRDNPLTGLTNESQSLNFVLDGSIAPLNWGGYIFGATTNTIQLLDTVTHLRGRHTLKAGFEFRNIRSSELDSSFNTVGQFQYGPNAPTVVDIPTASGVTIPAGTQIVTAMVPFLEAAPTSIYSQGSTPGYPPQSYYRIDESAYEGFVQDDFKATSKLTLNLGLRYEYHGVPSWRNRGNAGGVFGGPLVGHYLFNPDPVYNPDYHNFAPRLGFAYRVTPQTVVRGGFAIFTVLPILQGAEGSYETFPSATVVAGPIPEDQRTTVVVLDGPVAPIGHPYYDINGKLLVPGGPGSPTNLVFDGVRFHNETGNLLASNSGSGTFARNFVDPYVMNWNFTLERELSRGIVVSGAYVGTSGVDLEGISAPWCGIGASNPACVALAPTWNSNGVAVPIIVDNSAHSTYHSLQLEAKKTNAERGYTFTAAYTYGKNLSNNDAIFSNTSGSGNFAGTGTDPLDRRLDKGPSIYDVRSLFSGSVIYSPPFSHWMGFLPHRLADGWDIISIASLRSGLPFSIVIPGGYSGFGTFQGADRPDFLSAPPRAPSGSDPTQWFSNDVTAYGNGPTVFCGDPTAKYFCAAQLRPGTLGKGTFRGPGFKDISLSLFKTTAITERVRLQFRVETFNLFNFVNFDQPNTTLFSGGFGRITSTVSTPSPPVTQREIQFALKLQF